MKKGRNSVRLWWQKLWCITMLLLLLLPSSSSGLRCYEGDGGDYREVDCDFSACRGGIDCLCLKVPEHEGREVRRCWANPHSAQRPGCHYGYYSGDHYAHICTCQGDLCNGAGRATGSTVATAAAIATGAFFVIRHFGAGNLGIG